MHIVETLLLFTLIVIGARAAYTDIRAGYIYNKELAAAFIPGTVLNVVYYTVFVRDITWDFLLNLAVVLLLELLLYKMHAYAGGDLKLGMLLAYLYPARMYAPYSGVIVTLFFYIGFAIFYGYIYLLADAVRRAVTKRSNLSGRYAAGYVKNFLVAYLRASVYIILLTLAAYAAGNYFLIPSWALWIICMLAAWESRRSRVMRNRVAVLATMAADVVLAVMMRVIPFSLYPETYLFSAVLLVFQILISAALYEEIDTENVKKGMILSKVSSALMQGSRVRGLPGISSESLADRLTEKQAESVVRWGKTKTGRKKVTVMRKIPFAIFLLLGIVTYFMIWVILYEI